MKGNKREVIVIDNKSNDSNQTKEKPNQKIETDKTVSAGISECYLFSFKGCYVFIYYNCLYISLGLLKKCCKSSEDLYFVRKRYLDVSN